MPAEILVERGEVVCSVSRGRSHVANLWASLVRQREKMFPQQWAFPLRREEVTADAKNLFIQCHRSSVQARSASNHPMVPEVRIRLQRTGSNR